MTIKPSDALWSQFAKSSIAEDKKHNFADSRKYQEKALLELEKLANSNQHLTTMDDADLIFDMIYHTEEDHADTARHSDEYKKARSELSSPLVFLKLGQLHETQKKMEKDRLEDANTKAATDKRFYAILSRVLPPQCQLVRIIADHVKRDADDLKRLSQKPSSPKLDLTGYKARATKWSLPKSTLDDANYRCTKGQLQYSSGEYKLALESYDKALKSDPNYAAAYAGRAYTQGKLGNYKAAISDYNRADKLNPNNPSIYFNRGVALCFCKEYKNAIDDFTRVLKIDSEDVLSYFYRGLAREGLADKNAAQDYDQVMKMFISTNHLGEPRLELSPDKLYDHYNRNYKPVLASDKDKPMPENLRVSKSERKSAAECVKKAQALYDQHDYQGAILNCNKALQLDPEQLQACVIRMRAHGELGDLKSMNDDIKLSKKIMAAQNKYHQVTGKALEKGTINDYNQWLKLEPHSAFAYYGRGQDRSSLGDYKGAIEDFTQALKYNPEDAHAYQCRGDAREKLGDTTGAAEDYNQAGKREPMYAMNSMMKNLVGPPSK